ncbi:hypothetical protein BDK51DRAFT_36944 [Blyttiomyces helicus]|uniref:Uncharacterized protein n=1 Tax=Blyttiomyces helicus TaxID=388810 RepID=A0A4P9WAC2_9FUNG|nr:hypothetical protein BDK51DRAFT_36944 [Blyttiomyces helicus]|eukprot:RKO88453.1 hypothetical protein BDK51DRAFT_36944 [Blyttiomyces helicus]
MDGAAGADGVEAICHRSRKGSGLPLAGSGNGFRCAKLCGRTVWEKPAASCQSGVGVHPRGAVTDIDVLSSLPAMHAASVYGGAPLCPHWYSRSLRQSSMSLFASLWRAQANLRRAIPPGFTRLESESGEDFRSQGKGVDGKSGTDVRIRGSQQAVRPQPSQRRTLASRQKRWVWKGKLPSRMASAQRPLVSSAKSAGNASHVAYVGDPHSPAPGVCVVLQRPQDLNPLFQTILGLEGHASARTHRPFALEKRLYASGLTSGGGVIRNPGKFGRRGAGGAPDGDVVPGNDNGKFGPKKRTLHNYSLFKDEGTPF